MWYRNPGKLIRELFPNQTKSIPAILIWSVAFIADITVVIWVASLAGITLLAVSPQTRTLLIILYALLAFALFYLEAKAWDKICSKIKK